MSDTDKLLDANAVEHVDFLSMDIEGFEPLALAGLDIQRLIGSATRACTMARIRSRVDSTPIGRLCSTTKT